MAFDYGAATRARDAHLAQVVQFENESLSYRERAAKAITDDERQSCLAAAKTLDAQAEQVRKLADAMQQELIGARRKEQALTFEERMAEARERGRRRGRDDRGNEL